MRKTGIDISAYQGRPAPSWFDSLPGIGVEVGWVQLYGGLPGIFSVGPNPHAEYQLSQFRRVGCDTGGYIWLPPQLNVTQIMNDARAAGGVEFQHLLFGSLDIEGQQQPLVRLAEAGLQAIDLFLPRPTTLYTSKSQWLKQGNPLLFSGMPLHEAWYYTAMPWLWYALAAFDVGSTALPFGGWTQRAAWQFFGGSANGVGADWNVFDYDRMGIRTEGGDDMSLTEEQAAKLNTVFSKVEELWLATFGNERDSIEKIQHREMGELLDAIQLALTETRPLSDYSVQELLVEIAQRFEKSQN